LCRILLEERVRNFTTCSIYVVTGKNEEEEELHRVAVVALTK